MTTRTAEIAALISALQLPAAESVARLACEQRPQDIDAWYLQAAVHSMLGHWQEVARCCREVILLNPNHAEAHYNLGTALANLEQFSAAAMAFERVIALSSDSLDAVLGLANCHKRDGRLSVALQTIQHGLERFEDTPGIHLAHADTLLELGQAETAVRSYQAALRLSPRDATIHFGLGCALQRLGRPADAQPYFETAIALNPRFTDAHGRLGSVFAETGRWAEAIRCFNQILALEPEHLSALINCGAALRALGRPAEAADLYRRALDSHPDSELARYFAATVGIDCVPGQAPQTYIKELFDSYSGRFAKHLVDTLQYSTPAVVAGTLEEILGTKSGHASVLDLGCGTGLVGLAIRGAAARLAGVDLSERMIEQAAQSGAYDELHVAEIGAFLIADRGAYDIVVAADVFVYIGDLERLLENTARRLKPGGLFIFSVERHPGDARYILQKSGRYAHSAAYVRSCARAAGLDELRAVEHVVRVEAGTAIVGDLFVFRA